MEMFGHFFGVPRTERQDLIAQMIRSAIQPDFERWVDRAVWLQRLTGSRHELRQPFW